MNQSDVIDELLGEPAAQSVRELRGQNSELAEQMQAYYDAVFDPSPESAAALSPGERWTVAIRTAAHTGSTAAVAWYATQARAAGVDEAAIRWATEIARSRSGDPRTDAIMRHVDLIVDRPAESRRADIDALSQVGLSPGGIVALSQVVAYVSYQVRLVAALRAIGAPA